MQNDIVPLKCQDTLNFQCDHMTLIFLYECQFYIKYRHKTLKPCKNELQIRWWLAENISVGHLIWLVANCLNNRILTLWELKWKISAHLATTGSDRHAKHSLIAQFYFRLFYCCYEANSFVSDFPHIDFFDTVWDIILCTDFLIISSKGFVYIAVTILMNSTNVLNYLFH